MKLSEVAWKVLFNLCAGMLHKRFVAGDTISEAIEKSKELLEIGICPIINILGEHVTKQEEAGKFFSQYLALINRLAREGLDGVHISVKPSQLGLGISKYFCHRYLLMLLKQADLYLPNSLVEIDREEHEYAKDVREISLVLSRNFQNLRVACQVNLKETWEEIRQFSGAGISVRLCKGTAYRGDIEKEEELRKIFFEQALFLSENGERPAMATHDLYLIDKLKGERNLEFQVLLGIENKEMGKLIRENKKVGFYVPCGSYWRSYGERRGKAIVKIISRNSLYRLKRFFRQLAKLIERGIEVSGENAQIPW